MLGWKEQEYKDIFDKGFSAQGNNDKKSCTYTKDLMISIDSDNSSFIMKLFNTKD